MSWRYKSDSLKDTTWTESDANKVAFMSVTVLSLNIWKEQVNYVVKEVLVSFHLTPGRDEQISLRNIFFCIFENYSVFMGRRIFSVPLMIGR